MYFIKFIIALVTAYLAGSINFAILISRWVRGIDIRSVGNKNPGTSNVRREVGMGWAALVFLGDLSKGLLPLFLARIFLFPDDHLTDFISLLLIGMAAITGHCWPLYHQFKGGGGLATSIGVYMFFIPAEFFISLTFSFLVVRLFLRKKKYSVGQLTPMIFVPLSTAILLACNWFLNVRLFRNVSLGGHPWYIVAGIAFLSVYLFLINIRIVQQRFAGTGLPQP